MYAEQAPAARQDRPSLHSRADEVNEQLDRLGAMLEQLGAKLEPVLAPTQPEPALDGLLKSDDHDSWLGTYLTATAARLAETVRTVQRLANRVDL